MWSLGVMAFELLTGTAAVSLFEGRDQVCILFYIHIFHSISMKLSRLIKCNYWAECSIIISERFGRMFPMHAPGKISSTLQVCLLISRVLLWSFDTRLVIPAV